MSKAEAPMLPSTYEASDHGSEHMLSPLRRRAMLLSCNARRTDLVLHHEQVQLHKQAASGLGSNLTTAH